MTVQKVTVKWKGRSGRTYEYTVYPLDTTWNDIPGNYIFARKTTGGWQAVYVGETASLSRRIPNHEKWPCAKRNGATHIHAHVNQSGETARKAEELDLIEAHDPPCNKQTT